MAYCGSVCPVTFRRGVMTETNTDQAACIEAGILDNALVMIVVLDKKKAKLSPGTVQRRRLPAIRAMRWSAAPLSENISIRTKITAGA